MIKSKIYGDTLKKQLLASKRDRLHRFLMAGGNVRGAVIHGTRMVNEMRTNHEAGILETLALGHAYLAAGLMSASLKGRDRLGFKIECSGPIKGLSVEANGYGEVRGYLKQVPIPVASPPDNFDLAPFFGAGFLSVIKYLEDAKQPFEGKVMLEHGTIAKDLAHYYLTSEQIPFYPPRCGHLAVVYGSDRHIRSGTSQHVDDTDRFNLFGTVSNRHQNFSFHQDLHDKG